MAPFPIHHEDPDIAGTGVALSEHQFKAVWSKLGWKRGPAPDPTADAQPATAQPSGDVEALNAPAEADMAALEAPEEAGPAPGAADASPTRTTKGRRADA